MLRNIFATSVCAFLLLSGAQIASAADSASGDPGLLDLIATNKALVTGTSDSPPIPASDGVTGDGTGFTADVLREFLKRRGLPDKVEALAMPFSSLIPSLTGKRIDMIGDLIFYTAERAKVIDYTDVVMYNPEALVVGKGNPKNLHSLTDLCGNAAGSYVGTAYLDLIANTKCSSGKVDVHSYPTLDKVLADLAVGRIDAAVVDASLASYALKQNPALSIELVADYEPVDIAATSGRFAVRKGDQKFIDAFNEEYAKMLADGTVAALLTKNGLTPVRLFQPR
jgi:polar amino acid transport system substrate-binding protein